MTHNDTVSPCGSSKAFVNLTLMATALNGWGVSPIGIPPPVTGLRGNSEYTPGQLEAIKRKTYRKIRKVNRKLEGRR